MKVLITKSASSPYRVDFYNNFGKYVDLEILYEYRIAKGRDKTWSIKKAENFKEIFMHGIKLFGRFFIPFDFKKYLEADYDIIIVGEYSTIAGLFISKYLHLKNIPFILNFDGGYIKNEKRFKYNIKKKIISSASWWLSSSKSTDQYLVHYGADQDKIFRYPFTSLHTEDILTDTISQFDKEEIKRELEIKYNKIVISVGRLIYSKGFDILIKAARDFGGDVGVYIVGGEPTEELKKIIAEYSLDNIHFIDFKVKKELAKYYKMADIFVLPTRKDVWGLVINEAMSYGLPVITTDKCVAGLELIEQEVNGYIVPTDDPKSISDKVNYLFNNAKILNEMSQNNLSKIKKYTIEEMAKVHYEIVNHIVKSEDK